MIPFGSYAPDQPDYANAGGATVAQNVLPRTKGSYTPMASLTAVSDALTATCQGAFASRDKDGNVKTFAGDATKLYELNGSNWSDVSNGTYSLGDEETWEFAQYGERVIAVGTAQTPQDYLLGTDSAFSDLAGSPPTGRHVGVIKDFVFIGNLTGEPSAVHWCAIDNPTDWPTIGTADAFQKQSDKQVLPEGGWVQQIVGAVGNIDGLIFMDTAIWRVQYEGAPYAFGFYKVENSRGTPAPNSVANIGTEAFYLSEDGFYRTNGAGSAPIGAQRIDKWFWSQVDQSYLYRVYAVADPINKIVIWAFPENGTSTGNPSLYVAYNWDVDEWTHGSLSCQLIFRDLTQGYNLDNADGLGFTVDTAPYGPDSRAWTGGRAILSAIDTDNKLARFTGSNLAAVIETGEIGGMELVRDPSQRVYVSGVRPYVDGGTVTVGLKYRDTTQASTSTDGPNSVDGDGAAHFSRSARYVRAQVNIAAGGTWTHAQGVDFDAVADGQI